MIELLVEGRASDEEGVRYHLAGYSSSEASTPLYGGDSSGGTGELSFSAVADGVEIERMYGREIEITDGSKGRVRGKVTSLTIRNGIADVVASATLSALNAERSVAPFVGTLSGALTYYMGLADIPPSRLNIDPSIMLMPVAFPGFVGSLWDSIKQMTTVLQIEIAEVAGVVTVRPVRSRLVSRASDSEVAWGTTNIQLARSVEVWNNNTRFVTDALLYPAHLDPQQSSPRIMPNETVTLVEPINGSATTVIQPVAVDYISSDHATSSVYVVMDNEGQVYPASEWRNRGGSVTVSIEPGGSSLRIVITGCGDTQRGPFALAMPYSDGEDFPSLRIVGNGVMWDRQLLSFRTGVDDSDTAAEVGVTLDIPYVSNAAQAYQVAMGAAARACGPLPSISITTPIANRDDDNDAPRIATFGDFNTEFAGLTFAQFNAQWTGKTFDDLNDHMAELVQDRFENQAFGNVVGARVFERNSAFRVREATIEPERIAYTGEADTTFADFNSRWEGKTFADFNSHWANSVFSDLSLQPLK